MTPERWRQVEKLYHSAREHGPAVLADTDPELRREVERLLAQDSDGKILDQPIEHFLGDSTETKLPWEAPPEWAGQSISHYRILEKLGAGGMGVVYKALDTKLGRLVALKFLPPHVRHDDALKKRLAAEARAASLLDHPNIVVIHEIDETPEGGLFIAMAYHEGATLRQRISGGLPVVEALTIARQIALGLARAHQSGIVHRDIKPANVIVSWDDTARIIDFGLSKTSDSTITDEGFAKGTPLYMSPEQAAGKRLDARTDLWSLGAVMYEMLAGKPPFSGDSQLQVMHSIVNHTPARLREVRPDLPAELDAITAKALEKDPARRYQSAGEMARDISVALAALETRTVRRPRVRKAYAAAAAVVLLAIAGAGTWFYKRAEERRWVREEAIPQMRALASTKGAAMFRMLTKAETILPGDPELVKLAADQTRVMSVESVPQGAKVEIQDYTSPGDPWLPLGTTPLRVRLPQGYFRWRATKAGAGELIAAPDMKTEPVHFELAPAGLAPGMVRVPAGRIIEMIGFVGWLTNTLPAFDIDKYEVTNAEYQEFVDQGGYRKPEYWKEKFVSEGKTLTWEQAMDLLRDTTGRPGPSTWEGGHYRAGRGDFPVSGVSWYEAAAYAAFRGKSLPALPQWFRAAPSDLAGYAASQSNVLGALRKVGSGVGPYGTYDMVGNAWEWCLNTVDGDKRFTLSGTRLTESNQLYVPEALPPLARTGLNGFRCVRNREPLPANAAAPMVRMLRDFSKTKLPSEAEFESYRAMYAYDSSVPVDPKGETPLPTAVDWTASKLTIDAGFENERLPLYVFLPKGVHPPYQAVLFFPSARVNARQLSDDLGDMEFVDYAVQNGRALICPIFTGTYRRWGNGDRPGAIGQLDTMIKNAKELRRTLDYLETRRDIDHTKIAYLGVSQGGPYGLIFAALADRFRALVLLDGGFFLGNPVAAADPVNFVARVKKPVLMINGRYDPTFPPDLAQKPMFDMLGTPAADKRYVLADAPHDASQQRPLLLKEVLGWLDKYLGRVN